MRPIEVLVDASATPAPAEMVPSERANELADEFVALQRQVDAFEADLEARGNGTASALQAVEAARAELAAAERAMRKPNLSPDDVIELEAAHEAMLDAEPSSSGRFRRGGSKRFDEAVAAQQAILDRVGFPTWSAYVMGAGLLGIDPHGRGAPRAGPDADRTRPRPTGPRSPPPSRPTPATAPCSTASRPSTSRRSTCSAATTSRPISRTRCARSGCPRAR